jgi:hypothetical protein
MSFSRARQFVTLNETLNTFQCTLASEASSVQIF